MKITKDDTGFNIVGLSIGDIHLPFGEFWWMVNVGIERGTRNEIEEYLEYCEEYEEDEYFNPADILNDEKLLDEITDRLLDVRCEAQTSEQIYDVIKHCVNNIK